MQAFNFENMCRRKCRCDMKVNNYEVLEERRRGELEWE